MERRVPYGVGRTLLLALVVAVSCGREQVVAPGDLRQREAAARTHSIGIQPDTFSAVKQEIAALKMLLEADGGLDQLLNRGVDSGVIARRREVAKSDLNALQERLARGEREFTSPQILGRGAPGNESASANFVGDVPQSEAPPCIVNLSADGCFFDWYSTIDYHGSGTVYQIASTAFHHNTTTYIKDNGSSIDPPKSTNNFALQPFWRSCAEICVESETMVS